MDLRLLRHVPIGMQTFSKLTDANVGARHGGSGIAASQDLGLLVVSCTATAGHDVLLVFALPDDIARGGGDGVRELEHVGTLGGVAPMKFKFRFGGFPSVFFDTSGHMAFMDCSRRLLVVSDAGHGAVHVIDVAEQQHVGYVAAPGSIVGPRGVATKGSSVAVSSWYHSDSGDHMVHVYEGTGATWTPQRTIAGGFRGPGPAAGQLWMPNGLRFSADGLHLAVADCINGRVSVFCTRDGSFKQNIETSYRQPDDIVECGNGEWLVCHRDRVCVAGSKLESASAGSFYVGSFSSALALVPGLGLMIRQHHRVLFFCNP
jgi:hypothetical protein